jgi:hypothetical protein
MFNDLRGEVIVCYTITKMNDNINMDSVIACIFIIVDWKAHGSEYYECSRYKENPNIANESALAKYRFN